MEKSRDATSLSPYEGISAEYYQQIMNHTKSYQQHHAKKTRESQLSRISEGQNQSEREYIPLAAFKNDKNQDTISSNSSLRGHSGFEGMEKYTHDNIEGKNYLRVTNFFEVIINNKASITTNNQSAQNGT